MEPGRSVLAGTLIGVGMMAAVDEIVFHQLLAWHHFYDRSTPEIGLFSDGLLHAAQLVFLVAGFFLLAELRHRQRLAARRAWSGFFLGAGGFQVFDGVINHKVLRVHQVRYDVENLLPYDLAWISAGVLLILLGVLLMARSPSRRRRQ